MVKASHFLKFTNTSKSYCFASTGPSYRSGIRFQPDPRVHSLANIRRVSHRQVLPAMEPRVLHTILPAL